MYGDAGDHAPVVPGITRGVCAQSSSDSSALVASPRSQAYDEVVEAGDGRFVCVGHVRRQHHVRGVAGAQNGPQAGRDSSALQFLVIGDALVANRIEFIDRDEMRW